MEYVNNELVMTTSRLFSLESETVQLKSIKEMQNIILSNIVSSDMKKEEYFI
jgi:hypothetical protein